MTQATQHTPAARRRLWLPSFLLPPGTPAVIDNPRRIVSRPLGRRGRLRRLSDGYPGMRATTLHTRALGLFDAASTLTARGIPIGDILSGGGLFVFDPWELYPSVIRDPNMFVLGKLGERKSTLIKVYVVRQSVFGRVIRIIDVRGEYLALARALGPDRASVIRLAKNGGTRLNPLESPDDRHELLRAVAQAVLPRPLADREPAILNTALDDVARAQSVPTLPAVINALMYPTAEMAAELATTPRRLAAEARNVALALQPLCSHAGDLRGMFDGPTTPGLDLTADLVVLDLSAMLNSASEGIVMSCAAAFLQATIDRERARFEAAGRNVIFIIDEAWKVFSVVGLGEWLQTQFKNSRIYGQQNVGIMHRPSDLAAAGDTGSRVVKLIEGLTADCSTFVVFHLEGDELTDTTRMLSLSHTEQDRIDSLTPGQALWKVGDQRFIVQTAVSSIELPLTNTDHAMSGRVKEK